jgi:hypothetical protein
VSLRQRELDRLLCRHAASLFPGGYEGMLVQRGADGCYGSVVVCEINILDR